MDDRAYAATAARLIDRAHAELHRAAAEEARSRTYDRPSRPGFFLTLRYRLPKGPMTLDEIALSQRYRPVADIEDDLAHLAYDEWIIRDGDSASITERARALLRFVYDLHRDVAVSRWISPLVADLCGIAGRLLEAGRETGAAAYAVMAPPFERAGDPEALLLFNRLAAFRYHRANAHSRAWSAEGLTAASIVVLPAGSLRERIEAETNRLAAPPFATLSSRERDILLEGLGQLSTV